MRLDALLLAPLLLRLRVEEERGFFAFYHHPLGSLRPSERARPDPENRFTGVESLLLRRP